MTKVGKRKRPASEESLRREASATTGHSVKRFTSIDRRDHQYVERVFDLETGEELHFASEPLRDHVGHGSAKPAKPAETGVDRPPVSEEIDGEAKPPTK
jgi:hypothetical protein